MSFGDVDLDFWIELTHIDEVGDGELRMIEEMMKLPEQIHILG